MGFLLSPPMFSTWVITSALSGDGDGHLGSVIVGMVLFVNGTLHKKFAYAIDKMD